MRRLMRLAAMTSAFCGLFGCVTPKQRPDDWRDKRMTIVEAIEKLTVDPTFEKKYAKANKIAKKSKKDLPVVTIMRIENSVDDGGYSATEGMYSRLQEAIFHTQKFGIVDPGERAKMIEVIRKEPDMGVSFLTGGVQCYGKYDPSDFVMRGELCREETGELTLKLKMVDTRDGKIFWIANVTPSDAFRE